MEERWRRRHGNLNGDGRDADADGKGMCDVTWEKALPAWEGRRGGGAARRASRESLMGGGGPGDGVTASLGLLETLRDTSRHLEALRSTSRRMGTTGG